MKVGESFWHCKRISERNSEIAYFDLPKEIKTRFRYITVQPSGSAYRDLVEYGENVKDYQVAIAQPYSAWDGVFNDGDRVYLDGKEPTEDDFTDESADNANYEVDSVQRQNMAIRIVFKRRVAE